MEVWERLITGEPLQGQPTVGGKIDLRGLRAPEPSFVRQLNVHNGGIKAFEGFVELRGVHWKGIDFSNCRLDSLRFFDCTIEDCSFEGGRCQDWRMWRTKVLNTSFRKSDLRKSALGGASPTETTRNSFRSVDFTNADLRQTAYISADMIDCLFAGTNLSKVDFQGTIFKDCVFSGLLNEVLFYQNAFRGERFPPNEMKGVDFRKATFRHVEFRNLDMNDVKWPESNEHIVLSNYKACLNKMVDALSNRADVQAMRIQAILKTKLKWAGPHQREGVLSKPDLLDQASPDVLSQLLSLCG